MKIDLIFQFLSYPKSQYIAHRDFWATTALSQRILLLLIVITAIVYLSFCCFYTHNKLLKTRKHDASPYQHLLKAEGLNFQQ